MGNQACGYTVGRSCSFSRFLFQFVVCRNEGVNRSFLVLGWEVSAHRCIKRNKVPGFGPRGDLLVSLDKSGERRLWSLGEGNSALARVLQGAKNNDTFVAINSDASYLAWTATASSSQLWDLRGPPDTEPAVLKWPDKSFGSGAGGFDSSGQWLVESNGRTAPLWPIVCPWKRLLPSGTTTMGNLTFSPDGRWIASASDEALYLWPMPEVKKRLLHTLPHDELMAKLRALTNLRVVEDNSTATGWKLEVGPFPGREGCTDMVRQLRGVRGA
jgi:WD40 repeat protein